MSSLEQIQLLLLCLQFADVHADVQSDDQIVKKSNRLRMTNGVPGGSTSVSSERLDKMHKDLREHLNM